MMNEKEKLIENIFSKQIEKYVLSSYPTSKELLPYVRLNIKKKRLRKKFLKNPMFYHKRIPQHIVCEYKVKRLGNVFKNAVWDAMNREGFARKILLVKPLPESEITGVI